MNRLLCLLFLFCCATADADQHSPDWQGVEKIFARKGIVQQDMLKVTFPRSDLTVKMGNIPIEPGLALTSWIGFKEMGNRAMIMGDLVLLEGEVAQVMTKLVSEGIKITALHNHLIGTTPTIMYLHFSGDGNPVGLAEAMRSALSVTGTQIVSPETSSPPAGPADWTKVEAIFGKTGQKKGDLFQVGFPRKEKIEENGMEVPPFLGMATGINFQSVGSKAAATGDFVLLASEVNPVVKALTENGIAVTAIHSHMLFESPRFFFLHFWGYDEPKKLARGLKAALNKTNSAR